MTTLDDLKPLTIMLERPGVTEVKIIMPPDLGMSYHTSFIARIQRILEGEA